MDSADVRKYSRERNEITLSIRPPTFVDRCISAETKKSLSVWTIAASDNNFVFYCRFRWLRDSTLRHITCTPGTYTNWDHMSSRCFLTLLFCGANIEI
jgi:hypothetical protein